MLGKNMLFISEESMIDLIETYYENFLNEECVDVVEVSMVLHNRDEVDEGKYFSVILQGVEPVKDTTATKGE